MWEEFDSFVRKWKSESDLLIFEEHLPPEIFTHASDFNLNKTDQNLNWFDYRYKDCHFSSTNHSSNSSLFEFFPDFLNSSRENISKNVSVKDVTFQLNYCQAESTKSNLKEFDQYGSMPNFDLSEIDKISNEKCVKHVAGSNLDTFDSFYVAGGSFVAWKLLPSNIFTYLIILFLISTIAFLLFKKICGENK